MSISQGEFDKISDDPSAYYDKPEAVLEDKRLSHCQQIAILKLWAFDAYELEVAQSENMRGAPSPLQGIMEVLRKLQSKSSDVCE